MGDKTNGQEPYMAMSFENLNLEYRFEFMVWGFVSSGFFVKVLWILKWLLFKFH